MIYNEDSMYKVVFYKTANESSIDFKWFETLKEATDFAIKAGTDVLEIKWYESKDMTRK